MRSAHVENLDDALRVGGDARKIGAVENRALQSACSQQGGIPLGALKRPDAHQ